VVAERPAPVIAAPPGQLALPVEDGAGAMGGGG
jgi:hypothetical protein